MPMHEKKWKRPLEAVGDPLHDRKSDILKWVEKKMLQWPLETVREEQLQKQRDERASSNSNLQGNLWRVSLQDQSSEHGF